MAWFDSDWKYRKKITLSRSSGAISNYPMKLIVGETSGASGASVDCNGHSAPAFKDIRFTKADGVTLLDHWVESITGTILNRTATVWIEFDSIGTSATTFYMYYGHVSALSESNGNNTFPFFDDFSGSSMDADKWYHWYSNGTTAISDGILTVTGSGTGYEWWGAKTKFDTSYAFRALAKVNVETNSPSVITFGIDDRSANGSYSGSGNDSAFFHLASANKYYQHTKDGAAWTFIARTDLLTSYNVLEIQRNGSTNIRYLINDVSKALSTANIPLDNMGPVIASYSSGYTVSWDWVLVRKFYETEPDWGTWGSEESKPKIHIPFRGTSRFINYEI